MHQPSKKNLDAVYWTRDSLLRICSPIEYPLRQNALLMALADCILDQHIPEDVFEKMGVSDDDDDDDLA